MMFYENEETDSMTVTRGLLLFGDKNHPLPFFLLSKPYMS